MTLDPRRSAADYAEGWSQLLPTGPAWPRERDTTLMKFVGGMAQVWGDTVDLRAHLLRDIEAHPDTAEEMLDAWERVLQLPEARITPPDFDENGDPAHFPYFVPQGGLPTVGGFSEAGADPWDDPDQFADLMEQMAARIGVQEMATDLPLSDADRRTRAITKLTARGGASRAYFLDIADRFGWPDASIIEYAPVECGIAECGDPRWECGDASLRYHWSMFVGAVPVTWAECGLAECGQDPQADIHQDHALEALIQRRKPAHTIVNFLYSELAP